MPWFKIKFVVRTALTFFQIMIVLWTHGNICCSSMLRLCISPDPDFLDIGEKDKIVANSINLPGPQWQHLIFVPALITPQTDKICAFQTVICIFLSRSDTCDESIFVSHLSLTCMCPKPLIFAIFLKFLRRTKLSSLRDSNLGMIFLI